MAADAFVEGQDGSMMPILLDPTSRVLGAHPESGQSVTVKLGPYGLYVELGPLGVSSITDSEAAIKHSLGDELGPYGARTAGEESVSDVDEAVPAGSKKKGRRKEATGVKKEQKKKQPKAPAPRRTSLPKVCCSCLNGPAGGKLILRPILICVDSIDGLRSDKFFMPEQD